MAMQKSLPKVITLRNDAALFKALNSLRNQGGVILSQSDVIREAVMEKYQRDCKPNGHKRAPSSSPKNGRTN